MVLHCDFDQHVEPPRETLTGHDYPGLEAIQLCLRYDFVNQCYLAWLCALCTVHCVLTRWKSGHACAQGLRVHSEGLGLARLQRGGRGRDTPAVPTLAPRHGRTLASNPEEEGPWRRRRHVLLSEEVCPSNKLHAHQYNQNISHKL